VKFPIAWLWSNSSNKAGLRGKIADLALIKSQKRGAQGAPFYLTLLRSGLDETASVEILMRSYAPLRPSRARGMSGVEMTIAIVILGAIFMFTLKGAGIVQEMKGIAVMYQMQDLQTRILAYQQKFGALPGDDPVAPRRFNLPAAVTLVSGRSVSTVGNGRLNGMLDNVVAANDENFMAWRHMRAGGQIDGDVALSGASARPDNPFGGIYGFDESNLGHTEGAICATRIPGRAAMGIDRRLDDGLPATGIVRATSQYDMAAYNHFAEPDSQPYDVDKEYIICIPLLP